jgi:putative ABC transport system permease protein
LRGLLRRVRRGIVEAGASVRIAAGGVTNNRLRAFLSILGVTIGVATLCAIMSITQGLTAAFTRQLGALGANTLYITSRPWFIKGDWWRFRNRPPITRGDVDALRRNAPLLEAVAPIRFAQTNVGYLGENASNVEIRGTNEDYTATANLKVDEGRFLSPVDVEYDRPVAVIGAEIKDRLLQNASAVGAHLRVGGLVVTVIGVLKPQGKAFGHSLDGFVTLPIGVFERGFGNRRNQAIAVTAPPERLHEAEEQVIEVLRRERGLQAEQEDTFSINQQAAIVRMFESETQTLFAVGIAVGIITLIVGGIGVMNIMLVAVTDRTREIGIRRALGARQRTILFQFLMEACMVTLIGGAFGVALGMGGAQIFALVSPVSASVTPGAVALGLFIAAAVGLGFGTWPAYRAARLDPIESLRYE